jgi:tetratricopeptide (TPR) repeat protein
MTSMAFGQYLHRLTLHRLTLLIWLCLGAQLLASGETSGQTLPQEVLAQARAFETAKQYDQAIASYRTYLALRPDDDEARGALARVLSWQGHYDEAVALYEDILTRHPDDFDVWAALARVKSWQKRFAEARSLYEKVLEAYPQYHEARRGLADTLYWSGDYAAALPQYETVFSMTADPEVAQRIQAIKAALSREAAPQEKVTQEAGPHAPGRDQATTEVSLPYRDYLKLGYSRFAYTRGVADEQNGLVEVARSLGTRTLVGRLELIDRFGFLDAALSGELYSPLWPKAWGYVSAFAGINPHVVAQWKVGGEVSQGLGILHPALAFLEASFGYSRMSFRTTNVNLLTPGLTVYLPLLD